MMSPEGGRAAAETPPAPKSEKRTPTSPTVDLVRKLLLGTFHDDDDDDDEDRVRFAYLRTNQKMFDSMTAQATNHQQAANTIASFVTFVALYLVCRRGPFANALIKFVRTSPRASPSSSKGSKWKDTTVEGGREIVGDAELKYGIASRIVAEVHNWVGLFLGISALRDTSSPLWSDPLFAQNSASRLLIAWTTGFFVFDTLLVGYHSKTEGVGFLAHAIGCLFVYGNALVTGTHHLFGALFITWELSTFFLHVRWLLKEMGHDSGKAYALNGVLLFVAFVVVRNVGGTYASAMYWRETAPLVANVEARRGAISLPTLWAFRAANVLLNTLNAVWAYKMARGVYSRFFGKSRRKEKL